MHKPWLKNYPPGVPEQINPAEYRSVADVIRRSCERFADNPAYTSMGTTTTFAEYQRL
jgi:long-chain acyl-CoA synthetase